MKKYFLHKHVVASVLVTASMTLVATPVLAATTTGTTTSPDKTSTSTSTKSTPTTTPNKCQSPPTTKGSTCPVTTPCPVNPSIAHSSKDCAVDTAKIAKIKQEANAEINRRLSFLRNLLSIINASSKLSSADKTTLTAEVDNEISGPAPYGLINLQTKINADVTLSDIEADRTSIFTQYRVYLLILPKVNIVATADYQQQAEANLTKFAGVLQTRLTTLQQQGKNISSLQQELASMKSEVASASSQSSAAETNTMPLNPAGYDGNTSILVPYRQDVTTAHSSLVAARNDAQAIVKGIEQL